MSEAMSGSPTTFGPMMGDVEREGASINRVEASVDASGSFTHLAVSLDRDATEHHDEVRLMIFTPEGVRYDQVLHLPSTLRWFDLVDLCRRSGLPLPEGITEPGTVVRLAPYDQGVPEQSRELLAMQVMLDLQPGEGRLIAGGWTAEWPTSLWTAGVVTGVDHALRRAWVVSTDELFEHGVLWRVYPVGQQASPLFESWLGGGQASVVWEAAGYVGVDLTPDLSHLSWQALSEAVLEMEAIPQADHSAPAKTLRVPITAR
jgi:hypothetical protein